MRAIHAFPPSVPGVLLDALMQDNAPSFRSISFLFTPEGSGGIFSPHREKNARV